MNKSELENVFLKRKEEIFSQYDTPGKRYLELGENLPVILFRFEIITGYVGAGRNDFVEEGIFFTGENWTDLGRDIMENGLAMGITSIEDSEKEDLIKGLITLVDRYYKKAELLALKMETEQEKDLLYDIAEVMRHLSQNPPKNFLEKVQLLWILQLGEVLAQTGKVMSISLLEEIILESGKNEELPENAKKIIDSFFQKWKFVFGKRA